MHVAVPDGPAEDAVKGFAQRLALLGWASAVALAPAATQAQTRSSSAISESESLRLEVGTQKVIPGNNVRSYSEGVPGIVDIRLTRSGKQFVIVALKPGDTTLLMIMMDGSERLYRINVFDPKAAQGKRGPDEIKVTPRDNVRLDFYFVQFDKNYSHQIGMDWPGRYGDAALQSTFDLQTGNFSSATAVIQDQALPSLDLAQATGWAKLMRHATLITANGTQASFTGGGEVNIAVQGSLTTGIHSITFGSAIGVLPLYDSESGRLELQITADVSDLAAEDRGSGTPGRVTSQLSTVVNLELGQSIMLAGLVAASQIRNHTGLPVLSQIPILGALFGTHAERRSNTEDVVFIVPSVIDAVNLDGRARIREALDAYEAYTGNLDEVRLRPWREIPHPGDSGSVPGDAAPERP